MITEKQKQLITLLQLLSDGCTQKEIAYKMKITVRTVEYRLKKVRTALDCVSNEQIIKKVTLIELVN